MATSVKLDPLAQAHVDALKAALAKDFGLDADQKDIVAASAFGVTAAQLVGMLMEFTKARAASQSSSLAADRLDE